MGYGTVSREQELENALRRLIDLYDEGVLGHSPLNSMDENAELESALESAALAIELEDDEDFDFEEDEETPTF